MKCLLIPLAIVITLPACKPVEDTRRISVPACRSPDVAQGILSIGDTQFKPYRIQATATEDATGRPALSIKFDDESAAKLAAITEARIGEAVPLRIDDEVLMSPRVMERISGGNILVTGDFEIDELERLAVRLASPCDQESPSAN